MNTEEYIKERMKEFASNIDEFEIGKFVEDTDKSRCEITNKTVNTIELRIEKKSSNGITCTQWFTMDKFNKRFKKLS